MLTQQTLTEAIEKRCQVCRATVYRQAVLYEPAICAGCDTAARELGFTSSYNLSASAQVAVLRHRLAVVEKRVVSW